MNINLERIRNALRALLLSVEGKAPEEFPVAVTNDSRKAGVDSVFVAIKGSAVDGHGYIEPAVKSGCKVVVCETLPEITEGVLFLRVKDSYSAYALLAELYAGYPSNKLTLVGVTGTNGKTTTAYLIRSILNQLSPCGLISTVEYATGKNIIPAMRTTPDALELQNMYSEMNDSGCEYAVMEVSSHALDQNRIGSAKFAVALFTNLTGDHLDYHKDMESYFKAKKVLFENHIAKNGTALINIDDPFGKRLYDSVSSGKQAYSFGMDEKADFRIENLSFSIERTEFDLKLPDSNSIKLSSPLCGKFNAYNITSAAATAYLLKVGTEKIIKGVSEMASVPGRMERCSDNPAVFVDYAHTDDALENVLSTVSEFLLDRNLTVVSVAEETGTGQNVIAWGQLLRNSQIK